MFQALLNFVVHVKYSPGREEELVVSEGGVCRDAAVLRADVDEEEVAGTEAVSPLVGAPVPRDPVADVHRFLLGAYSSCTCAERET